jgi:hypothetical protein
MCYAMSSDAGVTWQKSSGEKYTIPISAATAEYVDRIPQNRGLINQTSMSADSSGFPYIATYFIPEGESVPQYHIIWQTTSGWKTRAVTTRKTPFSLSGMGTKKIPISRPQVVIDHSQKVYLIYRDQEQGNRVTVSMSKDRQLDAWKMVNVTDYSVGHWEPTLDTELWKDSQKLHLFVQKVGQGDGDWLEDIPPQPVYICEVPLHE